MFLFCSKDAVATYQLIKQKIAYFGEFNTNVSFKYGNNKCATIGSVVITVLTADLSLKFIHSLNT
jgi:uncharacterized protein YigA (DUF484 family)